MTKHSPEPWEWNADDGLVYGADHWDVCLVKGPGDDPAAIANARRIVACVNACKGVDTKELEDVAEGAVQITVDDVLQQLVTNLARLNEAEALLRELQEIEVGFETVNWSPKANWQKRRNAFLAEAQP